MIIREISDIFNFFYNAGMKIPYDKGISLFKLLEGIEITESELFNYNNKLKIVLNDYAEYGIQITKERNLDKTNMTYLFEMLYCLSKTKTYIYSQEAIETLYDIFKNKNVTYFEIPRIIIGAKKASQLRNTNTPNRSSELLRQLNEYNFEQNSQLFKDISYSHATFCLSKNLTPNANLLINKCMEAIDVHNQNLDKNLQDITAGDAHTISNFANIYKTLLKISDNKNTDEKLFAEDILERLLEKYSKYTSIKIDKQVELNLREFVTSMLKNIGYSQRDNFSVSELRHLISDNISLVYKSDAKKAMSCRKILKDYLYDTLLGATQLRDLKSTAELSNISGKALIMQNGSLLLESSNSLFESTQLLLGKTASEINTQLQIDNNNLGITPPRKKVVSEFVNSIPNMQIVGMTAKKNLDIIKNHHELLSSLSLDKVQKVTCAIIDALFSGHNLGNAENTSLEEKINKLSKLGYDCNQLLHADNIVEIFSKQAHRLLINDSYLTETISTLSEYLPAKTIQYALQHNYNTIMDSNNLHHEIAKIKNHSFNQKEFIERLTQFITKTEESSDENNLNNVSNLEKDLDNLNTYAQTLPTIKFDAGEDSLIGILYSINSGNYDNPLMQILKLRKTIKSLEESLKEKMDSCNQPQLEDIKAHLAKIAYNLYGRTDKIKGKIKGMDKKSLEYHKAKRNKTLDIPDRDMAQKYKARIGQIDSEIESLKLEKRAIKIVTTFLHNQIDLADRKIVEQSKPEYNIISSIKYLINRLKSMTNKPVTLDSLEEMKNDDKLKGIVNSIMRLNSQYTYAVGDPLLPKLLPNEHLEDANHNNESPDYFSNSSSSL